MKLTPGRIVHYQTDGRNGLNYYLPAMITVTRDSHPGDYPDGSSNPLPVPSSDTHVHLTVLTPGGFLSKLVGPKGGLVPVEASQEFKNAATFVPGSGTYVEWDVPYDPEGSPCSWRWPERE
jgi:hypothetical protein